MKFLLIKYRIFIQKKDKNKKDKEHDFLLGIVEIGLAADRIQISSMFCNICAMVSDELSERFESSFSGIL
tara:strand:+ start:962 stop:1171 length:210 start_codon:yes stop_codon:yes gene_type:complete